MGHFGSFLGHFGNFGSFLGNFESFRVIFGPFFGANIFGQKFISAIFITFSISGLTMGHICARTHLCQHCRVCQLWGKVDGVLLIMAMIARILMTMMMMIRSSKALQWSRQGLQKFWWKWSKAAATLCTSPQKSTLSPQLRTCTSSTNSDQWPWWS